MIGEGLPLFDVVLARKSDPETSHKAARLENLSRDRAMVLRAHEQHPDGLSDFELAALLGRQQTSVGKRRCELRDMGLIVDSGKKRPAPSGSPAIVWRLA